MERKRVMTDARKSEVRKYVANKYSARNGRNVRIMADGAVHVTVDGNGSQMRHGRDMTAGTIFAGWVSDLLAMAALMSLEMKLLAD
jgi:hypothetical protein